MTTLVSASTTHCSVGLPATGNSRRIAVPPLEPGTESSRRRLVAKSKTYTCPLCDSALTRERYLQIVGVWDERKRLESSLKGELRKLQDERTRLRDENKKIRREMKQAARDAATKATEKERKRADKMSLLIQGKTQQIQLLSRKVKELQEQLKRGTTPQVEGLNYEHELVKDLKKNFPQDDVQHHGKAGDILHLVTHKGRPIGSILFECKLTGHYSRSYVVQTKKAIAERNATYGVLVTLTAKKGTAGFWVDDDVLVVHPFGAVHVAAVLRQNLIDVHASQVTAKEANRRAIALMEYVKSDAFRNLVGDTIFRTAELYEMLKKEAHSHKKIWKKRFDHYRQIHDNTTGIKSRTTGILHGGSARHELKSEPKLLPLPSL
jgi:hypothetical protein